MEPNEKKINRTRTLVNWTVAVLLALFLVLLSHSILQDLGSSVRRPDRDAFFRSPQAIQLTARADSLGLVADSLFVRIDAIRAEANAAQQDYDREKSSLDNWLATRRTLGKEGNDREVLDRTARADAALAGIRTQQGLLRAAEARLDSVRMQRDGVFSLQEDLNLKSEREFDAAYASYELKIFGIRLLFAFPVLILGTWFAVRFRHNKYKALYLGFTLYSLYVFFFALVPYLPSFGGYVRYGVGIILTVVLGYYAIRYINSYVERKRAELKEKAEQRLGRIRSEVAQRAFDAHVCPSCGRDFYVKPWEYHEGGPKVYDYCPYCGMELYTRCGNCGHENFAHFPYCGKCGHELKEKKEQTR